MTHLSPEPSRSRGRRVMGFTMIEIITALMVLSVVVRIGIPRYQGMTIRAQAAQAAADVNLIRRAVNEYRSDHHGWPGDHLPGRIPPELSPYLEGLPFNRGTYQLDWQNWALPSGLPDRPEVRGVVAVSIVTEDPALGAAVQDLLGPSGNHFSVGDTYTFVLDTN